MPLPQILLIPGFWEGTSVFNLVITSLRALGYIAQAIPLSSTGHASPNNPSMKDDVASIRSAIAQTVEQDEKDVILVLHSAGAFLGCMAIEGLSIKERSEQGKQGGIRKIVFLSGAVWEEGFHHGPLPFFDYQVCATPSGPRVNFDRPPFHITYEHGQYASPCTKILRTFPHKILWLSSIQLTDNS